MHFCSYAFAETDDGPERAAEGATTANTAAKEPLDVDGQGFLQHTVDAAHRRLKLLGSDAGQQTAGELDIEAVAQAKAVNRERENSEVSYV